MINTDFLMLILNIVAMPVISFFLKDLFDRIKANQVVIDQLEKDTIVLAESIKRIEQLNMQEARATRTAITELKKVNEDVRTEMRELNSNMNKFIIKANEKN